MHVANSITSAEIKERDIQYGVCFGPVLIANGEPCNVNISGVNPRTAIGQRSDGAVLMLVIDGRQVISLGATFQDLIDIFLEYGAVNACNLDGGASSVMMYRDTYGRYGDEGKIVMVNNHAILQEIPRKMPTFFMVKPADDSEE
jgi:exopolysaccharide biosynthesis protein